MSEYMCVFGEGSVSVHMCICVCLGVCPYVYEFIGAMYVNCSRDAKEVYSLKKKQNCCYGINMCKTCYPSYES